MIVFCALISIKIIAILQYYKVWIVQKQFFFFVTAFFGFFFWVGKMFLNPQCLTSSEQGQH